VRLLVRETVVVQHRLLAQSVRQVDELRHPNVGSALALWQGQMWWEGVVRAAVGGTGGRRVQSEWPDLPSVVSAGPRIWANCAHVNRCPVIASATSTIRACLSSSSFTSAATSASTASCEMGLEFLTESVDTLAGAGLAAGTGTCIRAGFPAAPLPLSLAPRPRPRPNAGIGAAEAARRSTQEPLTQNPPQQPYPAGS
jgi:hypothetical protein